MHYKTLFALVGLCLCCFTVMAQEPTRSPNYGGVGDYPVPQVRGGKPEYEYCVLYAKRIWRLGNMISEKALSFESARKSAQTNLGENAAREEIADLDALEKKEIPNAAALGAERLYRCAAQLKLFPLAESKVAAEKCFDSLHLLEYVSRQRNYGRSRETVREFLLRQMKTLPVDFLDRTLDLAYSGKTVMDGNPMIEEAFTMCFARALTPTDPKP